MDGNNGREGAGLRGTRTSFEVLHALQELGPSRLSEIADHLEMAESTTYRHLQTLAELRYVSRDGERYQLGLRFLRLGQSARTRDPAYEMSRRQVRTLAEETEERSQFVVEDHGLGIYVHVETGSKGVSAGFGVGRQIHLHCSSAGKAILSTYSRERVDQILDRWGLPALTEQTITDRDRFYEELEGVRDRGVAFNREEHVDGLNGVAVPVERGDDLLGALVVAGPSHRLTGERFRETIPDLLLAAANELELHATYSEPERADDHVVE
ncbi:IclR family transcriptional regulator [Natronobacterium texcoconense]|uniref:DNA-binding transcriptional regulator, IclR family n=1 Tax=Natronobacterium texcoconense TaxID=1095778 RepID=A0A1H1FQ75_NATTX|nr:IclR family transcriptional regulator [Natronobacterium texcoconense]SDR03077.1 DNA-binding transcriptional regulator, IclR family [Natronobacterium texcoconense]